ncbi:CDP-diacylglycerol--inositol 3-phosphatidyltransferase-like isoform X2 [Branchiostoma lanceolatum]|uniref:CDP-diacylglycerol--inositol 3-phosphatidyltransferase-like isoform X2 n=1 Tax=Branchiostoma lanceolatum TaxID=7740 RepID=UPI003455675C
MDNRDDNMGQYEVLTFVPNVIDYVRIVLLLVAYYQMPGDPVTGSLCYFSNVILDEVNGYAARLFNQCTRFGSQLDILVDLVGTCGLLTVLCMLYPRWAMVFQHNLTDEVCDPQDGKFRQPTPEPVLLQLGPFTRVGLYAVLFYLCLPVALLKTYINCVQLQEAVRTITEVDMQERKQALAY